MSTKDNFGIPVQNAAYSGSDRAKQAVKAATQSGMHTPLVGDGPNPTATQSDNVNGPGNSNDNLLQSTRPRVLADTTKPAKGATPPDRVNPEGRPGLGASNTKQTSQGSQ